MRRDTGCRGLSRTHPGLPIGTEDPGFWFHRDVLTRAGLPPVPVPVDRDGADPTALGGVGAVLVTPGHQYPTGATMSTSRRRNLVSWARENDALVIEDDYDGELHHDRMPVHALQADAPDRVVYAGTASKTVSPALRVGWLAVPEALMDTVTETQRHLLHNVDVTTQLALARFIAQHEYDRRARAIRVTYRRRYEHLAAAVAELSDELPGLRLAGVDAGGQAPLLLPAGGATEEDIVRLAAEQQLGLEGLSASSHSPGTHGRSARRLRPPRRPPVRPRDPDAAARAAGRVRVEPTERCCGAQPNLTQQAR